MTSPSTPTARSTWSPNTDVFVRVNDGGAGGNLILRNLPTTDPGVSGAVWNDAGTLKNLP